MLRPEAQAQLAQARRNHRLFEQLWMAGEFLDWSIIVLFYTALHLVDAHAAQAGIPPFQNHVERRGYVYQEVRLIWRRYRFLDNDSRRARYELWLPTNVDVEIALRDLQRIAGHLRSDGIVW